MKYRMPFIFKLWKNSFPLHLKAIFYLVPVIILLYSILLNALLPVLSQYIFLKNSDYAQEIIFDSVSSEAFRQTENPYMFSHAEMAIMTEDKVSTSLGVEIYFCKKDCDWQNSYFTDENILSHNGNLENAEGLLLGYDCAAILGAEVGDIIKVGFGTYTIKAGDYYELPVIGIVKPSYSDEELVKDRTCNSSLAIVPDEIYERILRLESERSPRTFLQQEGEIPETARAIARADRLEHVKSALCGPYALYKWGFLAIIITFLLASVLLMEVNYIQRNYKQELIILSKLGMKKNDTMSIMGALVFMDCAAAGLLAMLITKGYVLDIFLQTYVSAANYALICLALIFIIGIILYLKCRIFNKKLYEETMA